MSPENNLQNSYRRKTADVDPKMLEPKAPLLFKQRSWSPDMHRDEEWSRRQGNHRLRRGCSKSVMDDDLKELKACFELGFGFDSPDIDPKLSEAFPALEFYYAVNREYSDRLSSSSSSSSTMSSDSMFDSGDDSKIVKTRQWAHVVACSVRQSLSN